MSNMNCVLRDLSGNGSDVQFVPVSEVPFLNSSEKIFAGEFTSQQEGHGPSGSHKRTVCMPVRRSALVEMTACVFRNLGDGTGKQFVPASDVNLVRGERVVIGVFSRQTEKHGPSGSHSRVVCLPVGRTFEMTVPLTVN